MTSLDPMVPRPFLVTHARREGADLATIEIVPAEGEMPAFQPGQFNMLYVFGIGEIAVSVSGDPANSTRFDHTIRDVGQVSSALARLKPGAMLGVRGPFGTSWPCAQSEGADVVFVAGGLGLAPLRPAIYHLLANRSKYGRVIVLYGTRGPGEILYQHELEQWRKRLDVDIQVTVDHADASWRGNVGVVPRLIPRLGLDGPNSIAMVCGPEIMMRFSAVALHDAGVPLDRIYVSMERNMKCAVGLCGHCQFGPDFICKDGAVMTYDRIATRMMVREL
jgi:NAD(P)H-flavin reductase